jgi:hypothetical protein
MRIESNTARSAFFPLSIFWKLISLPTAESATSHHNFGKRVLNALRAKRRRILGKLHFEEYLALEEAVWLRGRGCVSSKTHWANVWLRKKTIYCAWVPQFIACETQGNEKQQIAAFCAAKLRLLFSEQWSMPPLFTKHFFFWNSEGMPPLFIE